MSIVTALGAKGFIGRHLVAELRRRGADVRSPDRGAELDGTELGHVVYCIGLTGDFRTRPNDTVQAHVSLLQRLLARARLDSLVYLSSTRLYAPGRLGLEAGEIRADPADLSDLYNLSKALGEALTLNCGRRGLVVRLSNVFGLEPDSSNFLPSIIEDALRGQIVLRSGLESSKNYVAVEDVVGAVIDLMAQGASGIYNIAGGATVTHGAVAEMLTSLTGCSVQVASGAAIDRAPEISIEKVKSEVEFQPQPLLGALPSLVESYRRAIQIAAVRQSV